MRLLTYNIHKGIGGGDRRYKLDRILHILEDQKPDLICLQEVDRHVHRTHYHDQPILLAQALGMTNHLYQLNVPIRHGGYGNLILSRWPFRSHHHINLRQGRRKPRGAQLAVVETPQGPLQLVNWHLGLAEHERRAQTRFLLEHTLFREGLCHPTLVVGDFNDWRNTLGSLLFQHHDFTQVTDPLHRFRSFPAWFSVMSLDKMFRRGPITVGECRVLRTQRTRWASDHLPVVLDCEVGHPVPTP
jgi:endonuclease/exonuclease/phosphatase family metal-dependent hydrolase